MLSKVGTVEVDTPLLSDPLQGSFYLAKPFANPFGSLLAAYLVLDDPKTGVVVKLAGKIEADPQTGQLLTSFTDSPEVPLEEVRVHLFGGARGALITPPLCGVHTTTATLTPWSSLASSDVVAKDSFVTDSLPGGGSCPISADKAPNDPSFSAGTVAPLAGSYSPFVVKLFREDGTQRLSGLQTTLPPGLLGKIAGVQKCSEAQIAVPRRANGQIKERSSRRTRPVPRLPNWEPSPSPPVPGPSHCGSRPTLSRRRPIRAPHSASSSSVRRWPARSTWAQ